MQVVFVDMDGVMADFMGAVIELSGRSISDVYESWPNGTYEINKVLGITDDQLWHMIDAEGEAFWSDRVRPLDDGIKLLRRLEDLQLDYMLLTSPALAPESSAGKVRWIQKHLGKHFRRYILCPAKYKHTVARPGAVLIDDSDRNVEQFTAAGGHGLLYPQLWNSRREHSHGLAVVLEELSRVFGYEAHNGVEPDFSL